MGVAFPAEFYYDDDSNLDIDVNGFYLEEEEIEDEEDDEDYLYEDDE
jgi:hypothetical protein